MGLDPLTVQLAALAEH